MFHKNKVNSWLSYYTKQKFIILRRDDVAGRYVMELRERIT